MSSEEARRALHARRRDSTGAAPSWDDGRNHFADDIRRQKDEELLTRAFAAAPDHHSDLGLRHDGVVWQARPIWRLPELHEPSRRSPHGTMGAGEKVLLRIAACRVAQTGRFAGQPEKPGQFCIVERREEPYEDDNGKIPTTTETLAWSESLDELIAILDARAAELAGRGYTEDYREGSTELWPGGEEKLTTTRERVGLMLGRLERFGEI